MEGRKEGRKRDEGRGRNLCAQQSIYCPILFQKMTQLEEEIDLKAQEVDFMKSQIATLTAHSGEESWVTNPGALQRQLIKQQQSMKVNRDCLLLEEVVGCRDKECVELHNSDYRLTFPIILYTTILVTTMTRCVFDVAVKAMITVLVSVSS